MTFKQWLDSAFPNGCDPAMANALEGAYGAGYAQGVEDHLDAEDGGKYGMGCS